ncbi:phosphopantothenoylcysteine decarboxylase [Lysinibacillus capsici]|uniref:phosphopantothenoylcysteine decarboxylase domain-containing protein n=1 Tax=Lysinibacillus capsici TaxID=2115968 RepID=UPI0028BEAA31|nr:phosphopantothenoylcysteine decarboxylase [Lysinibacillus capsici]WNN77940.1 phosphopantothenoylcysteine decarboxylase [Lysinibacillus capsici]
MGTLQGKTVLITSGGTLEKWDRVRGHTNLSKGTMGCYLAEAALTAGANVVYMHGYFAQLPENQNDMTLIQFEGIEDLGQKVRHAVQQQHVDIVIMAAAGSDWVIDKVYDQSGNLMEETGKMPSDEPPIIHFKKAPKVLGQIKGWQPNVTLVGFKLEATNDEEFLLARARLRMETANAQFMVANSSQSLYGGDEPHWIVPADGQPLKVMGKQKTAEALMMYLQNQ